MDKRDRTDQAVAAGHAWNFWRLGICAAAVWRWISDAESFGGGGVSGFGMCGDSRAGGCFVPVGRHEGCTDICRAVKEKRKKGTVKSGSFFTFNEKAFGFVQNKVEMEDRQ